MARLMISFRKCSSTFINGAVCLTSIGSARSWIFQVAYTQALIRRRQLKSHGFYVSAIPDSPTESQLSSSEGHSTNLPSKAFSVETDGRRSGIA